MYMEPIAVLTMIHMQTKTGLLDVESNAQPFSRHAWIGSIGKGGTLITLHNK